MREARERFIRSTTQLTEEISSYAPALGMMTVAQQVAHAARVIDWFMEGAFRAEGFALDFEPQIRQVLATESLEQARAWFNTASLQAIETLAGLSDNELSVALPSGPVLGGLPRRAIVSALVDHTAHHRGALTVYARMQGIIPGDPYQG